MGNPNIVRGNACSHYSVFRGDNTELKVVAEKSGMAGLMLALNNEYHTVQDRLQGGAW